MGTVGLKVGSIVDEIGTQDFLHAFFSSISYYLEPDGWGTRFSELMNDFYQGKLNFADSIKVLKDIKIIREELRKYDPDKIIWDIEDNSKSPPWGNNISKDIKDLSNYFVTSTGKDLFEVIIECLNDSIDNHRDITIVKL